MTGNNSEYENGKGMVKMLAGVPENELTPTRKLKV